MASNVCYAYQQTGTCKFGANCRFSHGDEPTAMNGGGGGGGGGFGGGGYGGGGGGYGAPRRSAAPCYSFQETGQCKFGNQCRFSHGDDSQRSFGGGAGGGGGGGAAAGGGYGSRPYGTFSRSAGPCYEFRETGACKFGDNCRFSHSSAADGPRPGAGVCYQFKNAGNCSYGANCRFSHDLSQDKKDGDIAIDGQPQDAQ